MNAKEVERLEREIQELRRAVERLRTSRRVLMTLLAAQIHGREEAVRVLETENQKLRQKNARIARTAWERSMPAMGTGQRADG